MILRTSLAVLAVFAATTFCDQALAQTQPERIKAGDATVVLYGINVRTADFMFSLTDFAGGPGLPIRRTYLSDNNRPSLFGRGWGSNFETVLVPMPDKTVSVVENGAWGLRGLGEFTIYGDLTQENFEAGVRAIISAEYGPVLNNGDKINSRDYGYPDQFAYRTLTVEKLAIEGGPDDGAVLPVMEAREAHDCDSAKVLVTPQNYVREDCDGSRSLFARSQFKSSAFVQYRGRLLETTNFKTGKRLKINYSAGVFESAAESALGAAGGSPNERRISMVANGREKVFTSTGPGGKPQTMTFTLDQNSRLIRSVSPSGETIDYVYDSDGRMTEMRRGEVSELQVLYAGDGVSTIISKEGTTVLTKTRTSPKTVEAKVLHVPREGKPRTIVVEMNDEG